MREGDEGTADKYKIVNRHRSVRINQRNRRRKEKRYKNANCAKESKLGLLDRGCFSDSKKDTTQT